MIAPRSGVQPTHYTLYKNGILTPINDGVIVETMVCISVNGRELATFMCSPIDLPDLALGFLRSENIIQNLADVEVLHLAESGSCVDIWLQDTNFVPPARRIITSGCGGGITFDDMSARHTPCLDATRITGEQIVGLMQRLHAASELYNEVRGVHTSALSDGNDLILVAQDVGRHNTIDRLWGQALQQEICTEGLLLLASGRISSEMINKAAKMGVPIIASRTSPTSLSVQLARAWQITLIGYARGPQFRIYSEPERIVTAKREPKEVSIGQTETDRHRDVYALALRRE